jgi:hypothetical protein
VTFQIVALGDVRASDLTTLAGRLPQESSLPPAAYGWIGVGSTANDATLRSASDLFIAGADGWTDDLNDEATLSRTSYRHGNYAGIWQMVLAVDQYQNLAEFDCDFGPMTESRTTGWQVDHGVPDRGAVKLATRQNAQSRLELMFGVADGSDYGVYLGYWMYIFIHRHGPNIAPAYRWDVENIYYPDPDGDGPLIGDWHGAAYTYANFKGC